VRDIIDDRDDDGRGAHPARKIRPQFGRVSAAVRIAVFTHHPDYEHYVERQEQHRKLAVRQEFLFRRYRSYQKAHSDVHEDHTGEDLFFLLLF